MEKKQCPGLLLKSAAVMRCLPVICQAYVQPSVALCSQVIALFLVCTGGSIGRPLKRQKCPEGINVNNVLQKLKAESLLQCRALFYCSFIVLHKEILHFGEPLPVMFVCLVCDAKLKEVV